MKKAGFLAAAGAMNEKLAVARWTIIPSAKIALVMDNAINSASFILRRAKFSSETRL